MNKIHLKEVGMDWHPIEGVQSLNRVLCVIKWKDGTLTYARQWYGE